MTAMFETDVDQASIEPTFFAPMSADVVDVLIEEYEKAKQRTHELHSLFQRPECMAAVSHFIQGNLPDKQYTLSGTLSSLFELQGALGHLTATFWDRTLRVTDVLDYMPQKRREQWFEQIQNPLGKQHYRSHRDQAPEWLIHPLPAFEMATVRATMADLLSQRAKFFAERVDGVFRALSREHVTNRTSGFSKRMIIDRVITCYGSIGHSQAGSINDLRCVIAKFMGRDEPKWNDSHGLIESARRHNGQWMSADGGSFRIRIYNGAGTAHIEVHPDMAWRLNAVLASIYPSAIPADLRTRPKTRAKVRDFVLRENPLPFAVLSLISQMKKDYRAAGLDRRDRVVFEDIPRARTFGFGPHDKAVLAQAERVLESLGGVKDKVDSCELWRFDYEPAEILDQVICNGCIPDAKTHQFYPTPENIALAAVERAMEGATDDMTWCEPSAGQGGLANYMPNARLTCVEISSLHCSILAAKGYRVVEGDFLQWKPSQPFSRIVMNPPFSEGRWQAHLTHAAEMLDRTNGKLVAILPAIARGKTVLEDFDLEWSGIFANEFAGTAVNVVILTATPR